MSTRGDEIIRTDEVSKKFGLPEELSREIVMEQTRQALLRSKLAWSVLVVGFGVAGWLLYGLEVKSSSAIWIATITLGAWLATGRYLAGEAIRKAARKKSRRLNGVDG